MKKLRRLRKGLAILLAIAMVVGLMPDVGTMKVSAEESEGSAAEETSTNADVTFTPLDGNPQGYTNETYTNLLDGTAATKWCCSFTNPSYVIFKASEPIYVNGYSIWTASDTAREAGRNPVAWTLSGCNDYDEANKSEGTWEVIHTVTDGGLPAANNTETKFTFDESQQKYTYFKLNITSIKSDNTMQIGEFALTYTTCEHQWQKTGDTIAPTCTEGGYDNEQCSICQGKRRVANNQPANGHSFNANNTCTVCGIVDTTPIQPGGEGTEGSPYQINTIGNLYWFAGLVNGTLDGVTQNSTANAVLTADIDFDIGNFVSIGTETHPFSGIFDGAGHTIKVNQSGSSDVAIFGYLGNSTVKNLTVTGTITTDQKFAAGIAMQTVSGTTAVIEKCISDVTIESKIDGDGTHAGLIGVPNGTVTINNCAFTGAINGSATNSCGGMLGYVKGTAVINNSYVAASFGISSNSCDTFSRNASKVTLTNCYYLNALGEVPTNAKQLTQEQFSNGEAAYLLQNGQQEGVWGQALGEGGDAYPVLDGSKKVYQNAFLGCSESNKDEIVKVEYSNTEREPVTAEHDMKIVQAKASTCTEEGNREYWACSYEKDVYYTDQNRTGTYDSVATPLIEHTYSGKYCTVCGREKVQFTAKEGTAGVSDGEGFAMLVDRKYSSSNYSKWCVSKFSDAYIIFEASEGIKVKGYTIVTGDDNEKETGRNPKTWTLYGCNDAAADRNSTSWVAIHNVTEDTTLQDKNFTSYSFTLDAPTATQYRYFKLEIAAIKSGTIMQMSEFILDYSTCEHKWVKDETIEPTCTEEGYDVYECTECALTKNVSNGTPAKGHTWAVTDELAQTCTKDGHETSTCSTCGEVQTTTIAAAGHIWVDDICSTCGMKITDLSEPKQENGIYQISTAGELLWFAGLVNGTLEGVTQNKGADAVLTADITFNRGVLTQDGKLSENASDFIRWTPIGKDYDNTYNGTFDGQNHTISGLYFDSNTAYAGLFGYKKWNSIKNVGVVDSYINGFYDVGGICGLCDEGGTIENCYFIGTVKGNRNEIGGVCGKSDSGTIRQCYHEGNVSGPESIGGVCGYSNSVILNCYHTGTVIGTSEYVGGVCGYMYGYNIKISNCYNAGEVQGTGTVGGVCGNTGRSECIISNCYFDNKKYTGAATGNNCGTIENVLGKDTLEFESGEVAFLLQGEQEEAVWGQSIGQEEGPTLGGNVVYINTEGEYYNIFTSCEVHQWEETGEKKEPTCTEEGYKVEKCTVCEAERSVSVSATGHTWVDGEILLAPTCTETGNKEQSCFCGAKQEAVIPANGHSYSNGYCTVCNIIDVTPSKPSKKDGVYQIGTVNELYWFASNVGDKAVLTDDIVVNTGIFDEEGNLVKDTSKLAEWKVITDFIGSFDGQGHTISGLYFNHESAEKVGLFGECRSDGIIRNVGVIDSYFMGDKYVGGVCGRNSGVIENCYNTGYVSGTNEYAGGVCGRNSGVIENCYNTGYVSGTNLYAGGVCGANCYGTIKKCYNEGNVSGQNSIGGVVGCNAYISGKNPGRIINCYNAGKVSGDSVVGGVCGDNGKQQIMENCYNKGEVTGNTYKVGALCGSSQGTMKNCYYDIEKCDKTASGGNKADTLFDNVLGKTTIQFESGEVAYLLQSVQTADSEGNIPEVWGQTLGENGDAYPVLKKTEDEGNTVYRYINCEGNTVYTNDSALSDITQDHEYSEQGICNNCKHEYSKSDLTAYISSLSEVAEAAYSDATFAVYSNAKTEAENLATSETETSAADLYQAYCKLKSAYEALKPVALTVGTVASPSNTGKQTGGGRYAVGDTVTLTAEGVNGWTFNGWYDSEEKLISDKAEVTFTVTEDMSGTVSYTAKYTHVSHTMDEDSHTCSVCGTQYYKVTFDYGDSTTTEVYTTGNVEFPAGDYIFKVGESVIDTADYTVSENTTITVESLAEAAKYAVTITGDAHCTLTVTDSNGNTVVNGDEVAAGTILKVSVKVDDGYTLTTAPESSYTVNEATTITAVTEAKTYAVTVDDTYYKSGEAGAPTASVDDLSAVPYGTSLTLTAADAKDGYEFLGWYQTNGKQLTAEKEYTVTITSTLTVQPRYQKNSGTVIFMANDSVIDTIVNATENTAIVFPSNVDACIGFEFAGWDKTEKQIHSALASGENVVVTALFEQVKANYVVTIYNAEETNAETMTLTESKYISVTAKDVAGKNFAYWLLDGEIQSYNKTVTFRVIESCTLRAVYSVEATQALGTALIKSGSYDISTHKLTVLGYMTVPSDGCKIVSAGLYAASANSDKYNVNDELTSANADYVKASAKAVGTAGPLSYTWTKTNVNAGDIWYVRPYIIYTDEKNEEHTVYGERITLCAGTEYDPAEKATAKIDGISYDSTSLKAKFVAYLAVPENAVIQKAGLVAKSQAAGFDPNTEILSANNAQYVKSSTLAVGTNGPLTYTWTKTNVNIGDIWYVRAYLVYTDNDGIEHTVYGDLLKYTAQ